MMTSTQLFVSAIKQWSWDIIEMAEGTLSWLEEHQEISILFSMLEAELLYDFLSCISSSFSLFWYDIGADLSCNNTNELNDSLK